MISKYEDLPRLENGDIDYSKVCVGNDFRAFPQIFKTPEDISTFIKERKVKVPVLKNLLKLRKENKLEMTPTETAFIFEELFDYIYDVYRVPIESTYKSTADWLQYIEDTLVQSGLGGIQSTAYTRVMERYDMNVRMRESFGEEDIKLPKRFEWDVINCYEDVGDTNKYYICNKPDLIEQFWIKTDLHSIQPLCIGDEAYARVWFQKHRVYIFGCDDFSYTVESDDIKVLTEFVRKLKTAAPVWNFRFKKSIHEKLEFTN